MDGQGNIDDLVNWINDDSKTLTKKQKKQVNKNESNKNSDKKEKKISKEMKDKLNKYSRDSNPFYKKTMTERVQLQKQYQDMVKQEKDYKDNKLKEITTKMQHMSTQEQQAYLNQLLADNQIET
tara:strand:- start:359 stop:730 length:372 start_codon:yes stop_codon:yes gene_type:complete